MAKVDGESNLRKTKINANKFGAYIIFVVNLRDAFLVNNYAINLKPSKGFLFVSGYLTLKIHLNALQRG